MQRARQRDQIEAGKKESELFFHQMVKHDDTLTFSQMLISSADVYLYSAGSYFVFYKRETNFRC